MLIKNSFKNVLSSLNDHEIEKNIEKLRLIKNRSHKKYFGRKLFDVYDRFGMSVYTINAL